MARFEEAFLLLRCISCGGVYTPAMSLSSFCLVLFKASKQAYVQTYCLLVWLSSNQGGTTTQVNNLGPSGFSTLRTSQSQTVSDCEIISSLLPINLIWAALDATLATTSRAACYTSESAVSEPDSELPSDTESRILVIVERES